MSAEVAAAVAGLTWWQMALAGAAAVSILVLIGIVVVSLAVLDRWDDE